MKFGRQTLLFPVGEFSWKWKHFFSLNGQLFVPEVHSAVEVHRKLLKTLGKEALSKNTVCEWCKHFKNGDWGIKDQRNSDQMLERITAIKNTSFVKAEIGV